MAQEQPSDEYEQVRVDHHTPNSHPKRIAESHARLQFYRGLNSVESYLSSRKIFSTTKRRRVDDRVTLPSLLDPVAQIEEFLT